MRRLCLCAAKGSPERASCCMTLRRGDTPQVVQPSLPVWFSLLIVIRSPARERGWSVGVCGEVCRPGPGTGQCSMKSCAWFPRLGTPHMKRPCQALAGRRVVDSFMSVFSVGVFARGPLARVGLAVPAGWTRAAAAGRAGRRGAGLGLPAYSCRGGRSGLRGQGRPAGSPQAMRSSLDAGGAARKLPGPAAARRGRWRPGWCPRTR